MFCLYKSRVYIAASQIVLVQYQPLQGMIHRVLPDPLELSPQITSPHLRIAV
jgi:hypothetical protein